MEKKEIEIDITILSRLLINADNFASRGGRPGNKDRPYIIAYNNENNDILLFKVYSNPYKDFTYTLESGKEADVRVLLRDTYGRKFELNELYEIDTHKREARAIRSLTKPETNMPFPEHITTGDIKGLTNKIKKNEQEKQRIKKSRDNDRHR